MLDEKGFDNWAGDYDESVKRSQSRCSYPFAGYGEVLEMVYRRVKEGRGKKILDLGFGTAALTKRLYDNGAALTGLDFSEEMIKIAREKMPGARLIRHDFSKGLPAALAGERFDYIICTYAIHHLTQAQKIHFLKDLKNNLAGKGEIILGDVMFETREELEACRFQAGGDWDESEVYPVIQELSQEIEGLRFIKISPCSGVCIIKK
ncbi:MAG: class I SAM-dependent methyltransferase [Oscillospiraceae bacterium]|nr:class I SAM-dependent methyltransferase [Oscillospiraceae bacterium]